MHYSIDCHVLPPIKYQITAHRPCTHAWHAAKIRFVTLLFTKVLNSLEKLSWLQTRAFHGVVSHNRAICPTSMQLLWLLQLQAKSEHSLACIVLQDLRHLVKGSHHASAMEKHLCRLLCLLSCISLSTQLLALVYLLSRCYAPAACQCRRQNTIAISRTIGPYAPAVIPGYLS